jgi:hypothetical protein
LATGFSEAALIARINVSISPSHGFRFAEVTL